MRVRAKVPAELMDQEHKSGTAVITQFQRLALVALTGAMLMYPSEILFWSALRPEHGPVDLALTWVAYTFAAWIFLLVLDWPQVRTWTGLLLAGAVYGWVVEGVISDTMYQTFPLGLVWTGLAWHALFSVIGIWFGVRQLQAGSLYLSVPAICCIGAGFGFWAAFWPSERADFPDAGGLLAQQLAAVLVFGAAQWACDQLPQAARQPHRYERRSATVLLLMAFGARAILAPSPVLLAFPLMLAVALWALKRWERGRATRPMFERWAGSRPSLWRRLELVCLPLAMAATYALIVRRFGPVPSNYVVLVATAGVSGVWFIGAIAAAVRARSYKHVFLGKSC